MNMVEKVYGQIGGVDENALRESSFRRELNAEFLAMERLPRSGFDEADIRLSDMLFQWFDNFKEARKLVRDNQEKSPPETLLKNEKSVYQQFMHLLGPTLDGLKRPVTNIVALHIIAWRDRFRGVIKPDPFKEVSIDEMFAEARALEKGVRAQIEADVRPLEERLIAQREAAQKAMDAGIAAEEQAEKEMQDDLMARLYAIHVRNDEARARAAADRALVADRLTVIETRIEARAPVFEEFHHTAQLAREDLVVLDHLIADTKQIIDKHNSSSSGGGILEALAAVAVSVALTQIGVYSIPL